MQRAHATRSVGTQWIVAIMFLLVGSLGGPTPAGEIPAAHQRASCRDCHRAVRTGLSSAQSTVDMASPQDGRCLACHDRAPHRHNAFGEVPAFRGERCTDCHRFHEPAVITTAAGDVDLESFRVGAQAHCRSCHAPGRSLADLDESHRQAARLYHAAGAELADLSASDACLRCHDRSSASPWRTAADVGPTFAYHRSHPVGIDLIPGQGDDSVRIRRVPDPRLPLPDGKVECQSCHDLTAATRYRVVDLGGAKELCLGCHEFPRGQAPVPATTLARAGS